MTSWITRIMTGLTESKSNYNPSSIFRRANHKLKKSNDDLLLVCRANPKAFFLLVSHHEEVEEHFKNVTLYSFGSSGSFLCSPPVLSTVITILRGREDLPPIFNFHQLRKFLTDFTEIRTSDLSHHRLTG
ncbi:hypothetical protein OUZ56_017463 [Daphnia magna]|uniref:Uncharacterized protein n=1 Tax=Daphnia magna TaxID=35525 RepID=A0ABR0ASW7_9CRUS|nr:hypothetical protein OUZ56_017463 [Daphnia magna]